MQNYRKRTDRHGPWASYLWLMVFCGGAVFLTSGCASQPEPSSYRSVKARVMNEMGAANYRKGDLQTALANFQKSLEHALATDNRVEAVRARVNIGLICLDQDYLVEAERHVSKALRTAEDLDDDAVLFEALEARGKLHFRQGEYEKAGALFEKALELAEDLESGEKQAMALNDLGAVCKMTGNEEEALAKFAHALFIYENLDGRVSLEGRVSVFNNMASIRENQGKYVKAWDLLTSSLACQQQLGGGDALVICHANMGRLLEKWGKHSDAVLRYERAYGVAKEIPNPGWMEISLMNIVRLTQTLGMEVLNHEYQQKLEKLRLDRFGKSTPP